MRAGLIIGAGALKIFGAGVHLFTFLRGIIGAGRLVIKLSKSQFDTWSK